VGEKLCKGTNKKNKIWREIVSSNSIVITFDVSFHIDILRCIYRYFVLHVNTNFDANSNSPCFDVISVRLTPNMIDVTGPLG